MIINFNETYLSNDSQNCFSKWKCEIELSGYNECCELTNNNLILPPLNKPLTVIITVDISDNDTSFNFLTSLFISMNKCTDFWLCLNYDHTFNKIENSLIIYLTCRQFTQAKLNKLFSEPIASQTHNEYQLMSLEKIKINAEFHWQEPTPLIINDFIDQLNEYIHSLFISQLEFQFPLVFNTTTRKKFLQHENTFGTISYSLVDGNSTMIPELILMINNDLTSTTCYQLLKRSLSDQCILLHPIFKRF